VNVERAVAGSMHIDRVNATDSVAMHVETSIGDRLHKEERGEPSTCEITDGIWSKPIKLSRRPAEQIAFPH